jgi:hypothetical protein
MVQDGCLSSRRQSHIPVSKIGEKKTKKGRQLQIIIITIIIIIIIIIDAENGTQGPVHALNQSYIPSPGSYKLLFKNYVYLRYTT